MNGIFYFGIGSHEITMKFELEKAINILGRTPKILETIFHDLDPEWYTGNEGEGTWSPYEILAHLIHGEKTDWVVRTKVILDHGDSIPFVPFDRFAHVGHKTKSVIELLSEFQLLRSQNLEELTQLNLKEVHYDLKGVHPDLGGVNLRQLLSTWVVHDLGHLAQIARVMAKQYKSEVGPWEAYLGVLNRK